MKRHFTLSKEPGESGIHSLRLGRIRGYGAVVGQVWKSFRTKQWVGYNSIAVRYCQEAPTMAEARANLEADILATIDELAATTNAKPGLRRVEVSNASR